MTAKNKKFVIGIDGGGTKTTVALANLRGRILKIIKTGPSNPRNVGIKTAAENIGRALGKILPKGKKTKILSVFIGLPAVEEEYKTRKGKIKREILKQKGVSKLLNGAKFVIGSDQLVAFRSGSDEEDGIMIIAGTGCVAHGWRGKKEAKAGGWGWLADEGSAFWTGQQVYQAILKDIEGRGPNTSLTKMVLEEFKVKTPEKLGGKIYASGDLIEVVSSLSILCDKAAKKGDKIAKDILRKAGDEAGLAGKSVIRKLRFQKKEFPVVLVGSMFKSDIFLKTVILYVKKAAPRADFILLKGKPVAGAVKLAIENI